MLTFLYPPPPCQLVSANAIPLSLLDVNADFWKGIIIKLTDVRDKY